MKVAAKLHFKRIVCIRVRVGWREVKVQVTRSTRTSLRSKFNNNALTQLSVIKYAVNSAYAKHTQQQNRTSYTWPPITWWSSPPTLLCLRRLAIFNFARTEQCLSDHALWYTRGCAPSSSGQSALRSTVDNDPRVDLVVTRHSLVGVASQLLLNNTTAVPNLSAGLRRISWNSISKLIAYT